jgi:hypothetical protein
MLKTITKPSLLICFILSASACSMLETKVDNLKGCVKQCAADQRLTVEELEEINEALLDKVGSEE